MPFQALQEAFSLRMASTCTIRAMTLPMSSSSSEEEDSYTGHGAGCLGARPTFFWTFLGHPTLSQAWEEKTDRKRLIGSNHWNLPNTT